MRALWDELALPDEAFEADAGDVLARVNRALDAEPWERRGHMRLLIRRAVLAAAAALLLMGTALAAVSRWDVLGVFFAGDTAPVQEYVQSPNTTVGDDQFTVTLESCVTDRQNAFLILTVKALTEEAEEKLADEYFSDMRTFRIWLERPSEDGGEPTEASSGFWTRELESPEPGASRTFGIQAEYLYRDATRAWLEFGFLPEGKTLDIPLDHAVGAVELTTEFSAEDSSGAPFVFTGAMLSPLTVQLYYQNLEGEGLLERLACLFLMSDGALRTRSDLAKPEWAGSGYEDGICIESATFRQVQDLDEITAIVVAGTAFPLDGGKPYPVDIPAQLLPFRLDYMGGVGRNGPYLLSAETLCKRLGADYQWDEAAQRAVLTYRGVTVALTVGSTAMTVDGAPTELEHAPALREGRLYLDPVPLQEPWRFSAWAQSIQGRSTPYQCEIIP